jgi:hypothetical protein
MPIPAMIIGNHQRNSQGIGTYWKRSRSPVNSGDTMEIPSHVFLNGTLTMKKARKKDSQKGINRPISLMATALPYPFSFCASKHRLLFYKIKFGKAMQLT